MTANQQSLYLSKTRLEVVGRVGVEPTTNWLKANCSTTELTTQMQLISDGRGREIRTPDILLPKQARYRTALYPVCPALSWLRDLDSNQGPSD